MKASLALLLAGASAVLAQTPSSSGLAALPSCGQTCVNNMIGIAQHDFGCSSGNVTCYCGDQNFGYGLRDCSNQACGSAVASSVVSYGLAYCSTALATGSGSGSPTSPSSTSATATSGSSSLPPGGPLSSLTGSRNESAISTVPITTTISSSGSAVETTTSSSTEFTPVGSGSGTPTRGGSSTSRPGGASATSTGLAAETAVPILGAAALGAGALFLI